MNKTKIRIENGILNKNDIQKKVEEVFSCKNDFFYICETPKELKTGIADSDNSYRVDCLDDGDLSVFQRLTVFDSK